jgi:ABC-2 type transport system permease protein
MSVLLKQTRLILRNDLRLLWREIRSGKLKIATSAALLSLILLALHGISILGFLQLNKTPPLALEAGLWAFFGFLMLGAAMNQAIGLFFERADFDLLLSSPVTTRAVLLARIAVMSVGAFIGAALLLMPLLDGIIIGFSPAYIFGYIVWGLLSIIAACAGVWLTLAVVRLLGARRARIWVQVLAAVLGASVYIAFQTQRFLPSADRAAVLDALRTATGWLGFTHLARAGRGELTELLVLVGIVGLLAFFTARQLARTFLTGLQESGVKPTRMPRAGGKNYRFSNSLVRATFFKDLRLIVRDPLLLSQILPSFMYILPAFLGFRQFGGITVLAPIAVVLAVQFSTLLSDAAVAGEECLDLIRASPSPETRLRLAKMAAGMALPLAASFIVCIVIAGFGHLWLALLTFMTGAVTASGCAWLSVTRVSPTARKDLLSRNRRRMSMGRSVLVGALLIGACGGVSLVAHGALWFIGIPMLGATALGVIACFTFIRIEEIEDERPPASWHYPSATTS